MGAERHLRAPRSLQPRSRMLIPASHGPGLPAPLEAPVRCPSHLCCSERPSVLLKFPAGDFLLEFSGTKELCVLGANLETAGGHWGLSWATKKEQLGPSEA